MKHTTNYFGKVSGSYNILVSIFFSFKIYNIPLVDDIQSGYFVMTDYSELGIVWYDLIQSCK